MELDRTVWQWKLYRMYPKCWKVRVVKATTLQVFLISDLLICFFLLFSASISYLLPSFQMT